MTATTWHQIGLIKIKKSWKEWSKTNIKTEINKKYKISKESEQQGRTYLTGGRSKSQYGSTVYGAQSSWMFPLMSSIVCKICLWNSSERIWFSPLSSRTVCDAFRAPEFFQFRCLVHGFVSGPAADRQSPDRSPSQSVREGEGLTDDTAAGLRSQQQETSCSLDWSSWRLLPRFDIECSLIKHRELLSFTDRSYYCAAALHHPARGSLCPHFALKRGVVVPAPADLWFIWG